MTVLFLTTMMPDSRVTGSEVVSSTFIETIREAGHGVIVLAYRRIGSGLEVGDDEICIADRHIETRDAGLRPYWWMGSAILRRLPYSLAKYVSRRYRRAVASALRKYRPELIVVDHAQMAWAVPDDLDLPIVYLAHNVECQLYEEAAERSRWPMSWVNRREARQIESVERRLVHVAAQVWTLSENDARVLELLGSRASPETFEFPPSLKRTRTADSQYDIATIGSWTWDANAAGLRWFIEKVLPLLPPEISVAVAGAGAEQITADHLNVTYLGRVPDAARFLAASRVIAVPSVAGAGVQIKTVDAIGTGKPVVATELALRGIDGVPPTIEAADEPSEFAAALLKFLDTPPGPKERAAASAWVEERRDAFRTSIAEALAGAKQEPIPV
jgi:hypothetical protein